jgi:hypothetical protein
MNTQLSPEEIQRYKQEMMNMYQGAGNKVSNTNAQKTTVISQSAGTTRNAGNAATAGNAGTAGAAKSAGSAPASSITKVQNRDLPPASAAQTRVGQSGTRFQLPDQKFIESLKDPVREPEYTGANARLATPATPDVGAIAAPDISSESEANIAPAPRPPASGTYYPDTGAIGVPNYPGTPDTGPAAAPTGTTRPPTQPIRPPQNPPKPDLQVPDTGYIEAPASTEETTGTGYLRVQVHTANRAIPVPDAMLIITEETPLGRKLVHMNITDENGYSDLIPLEVPVYPLDEFPNPEDKPYRDYRLSAFADGYYIVPRIEVPIFSDVKSLQSVEMVPLAENTSPLSLFPSNTSGSDTSITSVEFEQS